MAEHPAAGAEASAPLRQARSAEPLCEPARVLSRSEHIARV